MFTISILQLIGIIVGAGIAGSLLGFFLAAFLVAGGRASRDEERRPWPGSFEGKR